MRGLLVGNGINRVESDSVSWGAILDRLQQQIGAEVRWGTTDDPKPFPMLFEEIWLRGHPNQSEHELKTVVADAVAHLEPNDVHRWLVELPHEHILTTNYDRTIEIAAGPDWVDQREVDETRFSLFRRRTLDDRSLWHIHGEVDWPSSIMLGSSHYASYSGRVLDLLYRGVSYRSFELESVRRRSTRRSVRRIKTWVDLFYAADIDIIGLQLGFEEHHLWHLLSDRFRQNRRNSIRYWVPEFETGGASRNDVLESCGVEVVRVDAPEGDYRTFYERAFDEMAGS